MDIQFAFEILHPGSPNFSTEHSRHNLVLIDVSDMCGKCALVHGLSNSIVM